MVLIGPNGLGKTMLLKNLAHQAILHGHSARFTLASDMLHDLAAQDSTVALARRLRRYTRPALLAIDEVGYLSYDARYADLLFEVVTRRYELQRPILLDHQQGLRRMESGVPQRRLRGHPHRSAAAPRRDRRPRRQELSPQGSAGTRRPQSEVARPAQNDLIAMLQPNDLPLVCLPLELPPRRPPNSWSSCTNSPTALERHYGAQIKRHYDDIARAQRADGCRRSVLIHRTRSRRASVSGQSALTPKMTRFYNPANSLRLRRRDASTIERRGPGFHCH